MKSFGELVQREPQDDEQRATLQHVIDVSQAYQRGELPVESALKQTTKEDRRFAIQCLAMQAGENKTAVMTLLDGIIATERKYETKHGPISRDDLNAHGALLTTNWDGKRVIVFPLFWMHGEPVYPPYRMKPGEERREAERRMNDDYQKYRDKKKGRRPE